jgi:molecular chaperone DnaK (HSP70)
VLTVTASRFVVGIDLGTTNSALAYADPSTDAGASHPALFAVPQVVQPGVVEDRALLPSFLYLPGSAEVTAGSFSLPWDNERDFAVGEYARQQGSKVPTRLVSSAKSWLCHPGVDRRMPLLPFKAPDDGRKVSPLEASAHYLRHIAEAWDAKFGRDKLENQDIILTVPASFDPAARELTVEAARAAGLPNVTLLEEPQAAFYAWLDSQGDRWRKQVKVGDAILICDVGGGTTDLTLIAVDDENGNLTLTRVAVGEHILLGGDNMDLALAHTVAKKFTDKGVKLDSGQMLMLWHSCRAAKEKLFTDTSLTETPVTILGRGSKLIANILQESVTRAEVEQVLVDGFFPRCAPDAEPTRQRAVGLQEIGLPYASDPAITRHLAAFLHRQVGAVARRATTGGHVRPTAVLFNGGVFKAAPLRDRVVKVLEEWGGQSVKVLGGDDLDLAVARGAAYYGMVRRGKGVRIRGGTARSYYVGVQTSLPAVPWASAPLKALCVVPFGMEEGTEVDVPGQEFGLVVGAPAEFRFLSSNVRRDDKVGTLVEDWQDQIEELNPLETTLETEGQVGEVAVHLHSNVTEVGTLELWCISRDGKQRWKLEFNVREKDD